jgi:DNA-binding transcriptional MocR family regulator
VSDGADDPWERHAGWWQEKFTGGVDPEYEEQLLPLVDEHLTGATRVLDLGCGEGQVARRIAALGAEVVGIDLDASGPVPASVARGLALGAVAFFFQPRAHNPAGVSMTAGRAAELAALLTPATLVVVEDDHAGDVSSSPLVSLGAALPDRTVHVSGFSKSHGPDLRLAAVGGAEDVVEAVVVRRRLGAGWSSHILQRLLATMLADPVTIEAVAQARTVYAARRSALAGALADRGVATGGGDGIHLWVPVRDEQAALVSLASHGIGASPGSPFEVVPLTQDHIRVTAGLVPTGPGVAPLADALAAAATHPPPVRRRR